MFLLRSHIYEAIAATVYIVAFLIVRFINRGRECRLSYLALFACLSAVCNPQFMNLFLHAVHFPYVVARSEASASFITGVVSLVCGIVAAVRIQKNRGRLKGLALAIIGIIGGGFWMISWALLTIRFISTMAGAGDGR